MKSFLDDIKQRFKILLIDENQEDQIFLTIQKEHLVSLLTHLRDIENYTHLVMVTAVDYIETETFQLVYILHNYDAKQDIGLKVNIDREDAKMESIHHLWKQAATYQRELYEMFGISFPNSPRMKENLILEGWQEIPPMRKDFDTYAYSKKTYYHRERKTHDPKEYMKQKLYPGGK